MTNHALQRRFDRDSVPPKRRRPVFLVLMASLILAVLVLGGAVVLLMFSALIPGYGPPRSAPGGWSDLRTELPSTGLAGRYFLTGAEREISFADGRRRVLGPADDVLTLHADGTFNFVRRGVYNARSQLICVATQSGTWEAGLNPFGTEGLFLSTESKSIHVEDSIVADVDRDARQRADANDPTFHFQMSTDEIAEDRDESGCSTKAPFGWAGDFTLATGKGGRTAIYRDAPELALESRILPWRMVRVRTLVYERQR